MRKLMVRTAATALLLVLAGCGADEPDGTAAPPAPTTAGHEMPSAAPVDIGLAKQLSAAHTATAKYATDVKAAVSDGYMIITPMMPGMGYHYLNPKVQGFDASNPPILVYNGDGADKQLVALEWVFPEQPASPPLPGATYGSFDAACHYKDGTFVPTATEKECAPDVKGSAFTFWHPKLVTLHVWLWLHNPAGIFHGTNPLVEPFGT